MEGISFDEYLKALDVVLKYQEQILFNDKKLKAKRVNSLGTALLSTFIEEHVASTRTKTAIGKMHYFDSRSLVIDFNECTVEYFIELFSLDVFQRGRIEIIRNMGKESTVELLSIFEKNGYDIEALKAYY